MICEKTLLYSLRCESEVLSVPDEDHGWEKKSVDFTLLGYGEWRRPVFLTLYNAESSSVVDVDNVSLRAPGGDNLVANGDFSDGFGRWFFTSDDHRSWRVDNLWVHLLFEQGWVGLVLVGTWISILAGSLTIRAWRGDHVCLVLLASIMGAMTIGFVDSIVDAPRVAFLFFVILSVGVVWISRHTRPAEIQNTPAEGRQTVRRPQTSPSRPLSGQLHA